MIYTVTFNPAVDYTLEVENLNIGETNRSKSDYISPGGKGINVSRVLNNLDVANIALGFIGGFTGRFVESFLNEKGLVTDFVYLKENTRINVKIKTNKETQINANGPSIGEKDLEELYKKLNKVKEGDFLVLAGSLQKNLPRDTYSNIQSKCQSKNIKIVVDTTDEALRMTLGNKPFLLKPNLRELEGLFDVNLKDKSEIVLYGNKLIEKGAQNVIVSMGGDGAFFISEKETYFAEAPKGILQDSVGSGDSMVAGFIAKYIETNDFLKAFKYSIAAGSATAFSKGLCTKEVIEDLFKDIIVEKLY